MKDGDKTIRTKDDAIEAIRKVIVQLTGEGYKAHAVHDDPMSVAFSVDGAASGVKCVASARPCDADGEWAVFVQAVAPGTSFDVKDLERTKAKETMS